MRRSAAPSQCQGNSAKKPRFIPPGKNNAVCLKKENEQLVPEMKLTEVDEKQQSSSGHIRALSRICGLNINSAQAVESLGEISSMEKCNGENEHKAAGMKRVNIPKAELISDATATAAGCFWIAVGTESDFFKKASSQITFTLERWKGNGIDPGGLFNLALSALLPCLQTSPVSSY